MKTHIPQTAAGNKTNWLNPPAAFRGKPFWAWNGELDHQELKRQVGILKKMGMGGFCMHSRTGLITEYLGDAWFEAINEIADEGARCGLEAWIYDEDRWPSGSAGGKATAEEANQMKVLRCRILESGVIEWPEARHFLCAFTAELDELHLSNYTGIDYQSLTQVGDQTVLIFSWETMACGSFYNGNTYLDTMDRKVVEQFLQLTHDEYAKRCGERLGSSIPIVFTDEPHRGYVMPTESYGLGPRDGRHTSPWTPKLPGAFKEAFGYDLLAVLPEVFFRLSGERLSPHKWRYMELLQQLFLDNWAKPCLERSHQYNLALTGHVYHEDNLLAQAMPQGSMARYYEYMDIPGIDVLANDNVRFWIAKQLQSVARQQNKPWLLSELYGCSGWHMSLQDHKRMGDWQALFGINIRCHHLCWYTMAGEAKRDYPASIFYQSAWWREYAQVETYFSRLHTVLQAGTPVCDVLVLNPVESYWAQIHPGWSNWFQAGTRHLQSLQDKYENLFHWLQGNRIDFDYGDEDHLKRFGKVITENGSVELQIGSMRYRTIIVAGCETLRSSTLNLLEAFSADGGHVVFAGDVPAHVDAIASERLTKLAQQTTQTEWNEAGIIGRVRAHSASRILSLEGAGNPVFAQIRKLQDGWYVVLLNTSETECFDRVSVCFAGGESVEEWLPLSGEFVVIQSIVHKEQQEWTTRLPPMKERVFFVRKKPAEVMVEKRTDAYGAVKMINGPFDYETGEPNTLVLDYARMSIDGGDFSEPMEVLKIEEHICKLSGLPFRKGSMVQPWARTRPQIVAPEIQIELQFEFEVRSLPSEPLTLIMEPIAGQELCLNGQLCARMEKAPMWVDPCFKHFSIEPSAIQPGHNTVSLMFDFKEGTDLEALYLAGRFGVYAGSETNRLSIDRLPLQLFPGDVCPQGLIFYSDRIYYKIPVSEAGRLLVQHQGGACVAFKGAGSRTVIPWGDFCYDVTDDDVELGSVSCELILTRRNTFGPFHHPKLDMNWVAPGCFRSDGDDWTNDYVLIPNGLESVSFRPRIGEDLERQ